MREHIRKMIDEARNHEATSGSNQHHSPLKPDGRARRGEMLAAEAIRLARLATMIHLSRAAEVLAQQRTNGAHRHDAACHQRIQLQESVR